MPSELFLIDAQQLHGDVQAFVGGQRRAPRQAAVSAEALADLLRGMGLAGYAAGARELAHALKEAGDPGAAAALRRAAADLADRLGEVIGALRAHHPVADDPLFAQTWTARLSGADRAAPPAVSDAAPPAASAAAAAAVEPPATRAEAVTQARAAHRALAALAPAARAAALRALRQRLQRSHAAAVGLPELGPALPLMAAPEAADSLARALAELPRARQVTAQVAGEQGMVSLQCPLPTAKRLNRAGALLATAGGRVDRIEAGLRLTLPLEPRCQQVLPLRQPEGWVAVGLLQLDEPAPGPEAQAAPRAWRVRVGAAGGVLEAEAAGAPTWAWIDPLPAGVPLPRSWCALATAPDGTVMPMLRPEAGS